MTIKTIQKVIKIGTSAGVTIPAKDLKYAGIQTGDQVEVTVRKAPGSQADSEEVIAAAKNILDRYAADFKNLASR
jgi:antitoxin component of MazEF toxin-antitoxin module